MERHDTPASAAESHSEGIAEIDVRELDLREDMTNCALPRMYDT